MPLVTLQTPLGIRRELFQNAGTKNLHCLYCSMSAESQGALLVNSMTGASPRQQWCHIAIGAATQFSTRQTSDATMEHAMPCCTHEQRKCFLWVRPEALWGEPVVGLSSRVESRSQVIAVSWVGVSEVTVKRWQLVELSLGAEDWPMLRATARQHWWRLWRVVCIIVECKFG
jgi:hypothetical protein